MLVCDLTHAYHPTSGGIRTFIDLKRRYLLERTDHTHALIVPGEADEVTHGDRWTTVTIRSPRLPGGSTYRFFPRPGPIREALARVAPDVVELNTYYMPSEFAAAFGYRKARRAAGHASHTTVHYHTDFAESYVRAYTGPLGRVLQPVARAYVRRILRRADAVMTLAPTFARQLERFGIAGVRQIPQFVDLELFHPARRSAALRSRIGAGPDDLLVTYLGRLDSEKHVGTLVAMVDHLPARLRPRLLLAGDGPDAEALRSRAATSDRLSVWPFVDDRETLATVLASSDVYVTAGPHEVAAFSVVEAQASGLPVVGVDAGGLRDRIHDGLGFLVPVGDARAMARRVAEVADARAAFGARARAHAEAAYSWTRCFETVVSIYDEIRQQDSHPD